MMRGDGQFRGCYFRVLPTNVAGKTSGRVHGSAALDSAHYCSKTASWIFGSVPRGQHDGDVDGASCW